MHWAASLLGKPWSPEGYGPDDFCCWGLVHSVFASQLGIVMARIQVADPDEDNVAAIKRASTASGWRPAKAPEQAFDIVLLRGPHGRHVGVMVETLRGLMLLHADGTMHDGKPRGGVVAHPLRTLRYSGYGHIELWRRS